MKEAGGETAHRLPAYSRLHVTAPVGTLRQKHLQSNKEAAVMKFRIEVTSRESKEAPREVAPLLSLPLSPFPSYPPLRVMGNVLLLNRVVVLGFASPTKLFLSL